MPKKGSPRCRCGYRQWTCIALAATYAKIACANCGRETITRSKRAMSEFKRLLAAARKGGA